jgi:outer membrane biosynthesis protein TonB
MTTTAEFMIGRSADDATERRQEARKILWALLAALFLHLVIGYLLAVSSGLFSPAVPLEDKPVELTFVDLSTPPPATAKNTMFMETDEKKQSIEPPKEKTFESNANSIAASQLPATGNAPLPSQDGNDRPTVDLETHKATLAMEGAQPQPTAPPQVTPSPSVEPSVQPSATPLPDQFAMLRPAPTPAARPTATPQQTKSIYQPLREQKRMSGAISNRGASAVNAMGTPLGRYKKMLYDAVGSRWYNYVNQKMDLVGIGTARLVFSIDRSGRVRNLRVIQNSSNETFANVCLQSVSEVQLPPIPSDVADTLPPEGLTDEEIVFTMFPN